MHERNWEERKVHAYLKSKLNQDENIDHTQTNKWMNYPSVTSHEEGFLMAIQEQEITTRAVRKAREKTHRRKLLSLQYVDFASKRKRTYFILCVPVHQSMYLPIRHNPIAKSIHHEILEVIEPGRKRQNGEPPPVTKSGNYEIWREKVIPTSYKLKHNRPDILLWDNEAQICTIVEVTMPLDTNVTARTSYKKEIYMELVEALRVL